MRFSEYLQLPEFNDPLLEAIKSKEGLEKYLRRLMKKEKIDKVGAGHFSSVFQHPVYSNVAVKVYADDPKYKKYIEWALENQHNSYVPKIISHHRYKFATGEKVGIVFLQKLKKMSDATIDNRAKQIGRAYTDSYKNYTGTFPGGFMNFTPHEWKDIAKNAKDKDPDLAEFAEWLVGILKKNKYDDILDVHHGNVMADPSGHVVFVDPIA